mmetsp:Transcript_35295/g.6364  ORF Transcript_35295/g.6364 Transcript_35295/m.6364 type:complete len:147 (+) Transcript_35295:2365-2805(+)
MIALQVFTAQIQAILFLYLVHPGINQILIAVYVKLVLITKAVQLLNKHLLKHALLISILQLEQDNVWTVLQTAVVLVICVQMGNYGMDQPVRNAEKVNFAILKLKGAVHQDIFRILLLRLYVKDVLLDNIIVNILKTNVYRHKLEK